MKKYSILLILIFIVIISYLLFTTSIIERNILHNTIKEQNQKANRKWEQLIKDERYFKNALDNEDIKEAIRINDRMNNIYLENNIFNEFNLYLLDNSNWKEMEKSLIVRNPYICKRHLDGDEEEYCLEIREIMINVIKKNNGN